MYGKMEIHEGIYMLMLLIELLQKNETRDPIPIWGQLAVLQSYRMLKMKRLRFLGCLPHLLPFLTKISNES